MKHQYDTLFHNSLDVQWHKKIQMYKLFHVPVPIVKHIAALYYHSLTRKLLLLQNIFHPCNDKWKFSKKELNEKPHLVLHGLNNKFSISIKIHSLSSDLGSYQNPAASTTIRMKVLVNNNCIGKSCLLH